MRRLSGPDDLLTHSPWTWMCWPACLVNDEENYLSEDMSEDDLDLSEEEERYAMGARAPFQAGVPF